MQSYINHLLSDISEACREEQPEAYSFASPDNDMEAMERYFEEVERWLNSDPEHDFSYYCGLQKEQFPPPEKLTGEQMESVIQALKKLLFSWNIGVDLPEQLPVCKKYTLMVGILERKVAIVDSGFETIEFCTCDPPSCPLNEWCSCREIWYKQQDDDEDDVKNFDPNALPF
jgi:hypothetical protein